MPILKNTVEVGPLWEGSVGSDPEGDVLSINNAELLRF